MSSRAYKELNPFNGIERVLRHLQAQVIIACSRIHSMELKGIPEIIRLIWGCYKWESIQWNWKGTTGNSSLTGHTGIHSMELKVLVYQPVSDQPYSLGIHSMELKDTNTHLDHPLAPFPQNPFNGIESWYWNRLIWYMLYDYESIQWNWKAVQVKRLHSTKTRRWNPFNGIESLDYGLVTYNNVVV